MGVTVGYRFPTRTIEIEPTRVDEYVHALGVAPELDWKPDVGAVLPPGFLMYVTTYGADVVHDAFDIDFQRAVYGGMDTEFFHQVHIGDTLSISAEVSGVTTKEVRSGLLTFYELTCEYRLPDGTLAVRERSTTIQRG
ncbi:MAG: FAS1-like dehydratase domain-containing protein [Solirubrobacterales bacterium]